MKFSYQKPAYKFVTLETNSTSQCEYTVNHKWMECGVEYIPGLWVVFTAEPNCNMSNDDIGLCEYTGGHSSSTFGS